MDAAQGHTTLARPLITALWLLVAMLFVTLRFDSSERTYFGVDDQVVVWLVDDAVNHGHWQPDWYRAASHRQAHDYFVQEGVRTDLPHAHHYNFSSHILLSAALIKPLRMAGVDTPTITLLHHVALLWDTASLLLLIAAARLLGGNRLALCAAVIYCVFPLAVQGAHYARPDALLTAMGSAVLWLALQKNSMAGWRWLMANGLVLGVAVGGKASQLMLGIFPAIASSAVLLHHTHQHRETLLLIGRDGVALLALIAAVLALMFAAADMSVTDFIISVQSIQRYYQQPGPPDLLEHFSFPAQLLNMAHYFFATLGWPLLLATLAGVITLAQRPEKLALLLLTVPMLLFTLYFATIPAFFDRSFSPIAASLVLLAAVGINRISETLPLPALLLITVLACSKPLVIQYHLQTDHLRSHHNDDRLAYQRELKQSLAEKTGMDYWIKNVDRADMFSQTLPAKPLKTPRIYVVEDLNDWNSQLYREYLLNNGFVQIAEFTGDFADMPTNSLITVHEAARFHYFIRRDEGPQEIHP